MTVTLPDNVMEALVIFAETLNQSQEKVCVDMITKGMVTEARIMQEQAIKAGRFVKDATLFKDTIYDLLVIGHQQFH